MARIRRSGGAKEIEKVALSSVDEDAEMRKRGSVFDMESEDETPQNSRDLNKENNHNLANGYGHVIGLHRSGDDREVQKSETLAQNQVKAEEWW